MSRPVPFIMGTVIEYTVVEGITTMTVYLDE
jgi:hypothetical protein